MQLCECGVCFEKFAPKLAIACSSPLERIDGVETPQGTHRFCLDCIRGLATTATGQLPVAEGGRGLLCMTPECNNSIDFGKFTTRLSHRLFSANFHSILPPLIRQRLSDRLQQESIAHAQLENLQRLVSKGKQPQPLSHSLFIGANAAMGKLSSCPSMCTQSSPAATVVPTLAGEGISHLGS